jgi:hypothetical protein
MSKWTVYSCTWPSLLRSPQKWPLVSVPVISLFPTICALSPKSPFSLSCSLIRNPARLVAGKSNRPIEVRWVAVKSEVTVLGWLLCAE